MIFPTAPVSLPPHRALTNTMEPSEHDPVTRRLHSLGRQPIDPEVVASHRNLMASVPVASSPSRLRPLMVGSLLAGSLFGGMGFAAAAPGVPDAASDVAKTVLATVTLGAVDDHDEDKAEKAEKADKAEKAEDTPEAKAAAQEAKTARKAAKAANHPAGNHGVTRSTVGCPAGFTGNHGRYVSSVAKKPGVTEAEKTAAAESDCGKPVQSVHAGTPGDNANKPEDPGKSNLPRGREGAGKPERTEGSAPGNSGEHRADADAGPPAGVTPGS